MLKCDMLKCGMLKCGMLKCGMLKCDMLKCGMLKCDMLKCGMLKCDMLKCGMLKCGMLKRKAISGMLGRHSASDNAPSARGSPIAACLTGTCIATCAHILKLVCGTYHFLFALLLWCFSFEIKVSASAEGKSLHSLTGDLTATAVVEAATPTTPAATVPAAAATGAATQDVSSPPFAYEFIPKLAPAGNNSNSTSNATAGTDSVTNSAVTSETPSGIRNFAVGSCADLSAGVIVAEELPLDAAAQAAAVAAAGANGTTADGRGGKCLRVCGLDFRAGTNVTVMTPLTGYAQQQCGSTQVRRLSPGAVGILVWIDCGWHWHIYMPYMPYASYIYIYIYAIYMPYMPYMR
jgi:hypothetical protein